LLLKKYNQGYAMVTSQVLLQQVGKALENTSVTMGKVRQAEIRNWETGSKK
jgi:hypothetical protein